MDAFLQALASSFVQFGPAYTMVIGLVAILAWVAAKAMPFLKEIQLKKLELEQAREVRKAEEAQSLHERERERAKLTAQMIETQDRSNNVMEALTTQIAVMNATLEESKHRSRSMGQTVDKMAEQVKEVHTVVMNGK